jgi:rhodanese-related sulfurtransferase
MRTLFLLTALIILGALLYLNPAMSRDKNLNQSSDLIIIDVRTPDEFNQGYVEGAINLDIYNPNFEEELKKLDVNKDYAIYCRSGSRAAKAVEVMNRLGFKKVKNLGSLRNALGELNRKCIKC